MARGAASREIATVLAFLLPPAVMVAAVLVFRTVPATGLLLASLLEVPVRGKVILSALGAIAAIYFPPFLVTGSPDPVLAGFGLFLVSSGVLAYRRQYVAALLALVLPIAAGWWFASSFMQD